MPLLIVGCAHPSCSWRCCCQASSDSVAIAGSAVASSSELITAIAKGLGEGKGGERSCSSRVIMQLP
ncbi:UNVERIFIED_ORG: hypothetical protein M2420_000821 [Stenotrophomonas maltophilia]